MTAAEVTAAAKSTVPKGRSFAHHARHHARRERGFKAEPECDRRCENFSHPTSHGALLPVPAELYPFSVAHSQRTDGSARSAQS